MSAVQECPSVTNLITVGTEQEAALIVAALEEIGIPADYVGDTTASFRLGIPGAVQVNIHADDLFKAQRLLKELRAAESKDGGEPVHDQVTPWRNVCKVLTIAGLVGLAVSYVWNILV